jgi:pyruvate/2-oxoglutarate dehydrogenase complex dihydrolipoamide dehydrogenase (E3) component
MLLGKNTNVASVIIIILTYAISTAIFSLNVGCVPSKAIIHSANLAHTLRGDMEKLEAAGLSIEGGAAAVKVDFAKVMERIRKVRADISHHDSAERYTKELGVDVFIGRGKFTSDKTIEVNGRTLTFKRAVVATGGYPTLIPMPGLKELHAEATSIKNADKPRPVVMTNETIFNLTSQPKNMIVIGAGVIGLELAQAMQRLGTSVTVLGRSGHILPKEDEDLAQLVKDQMVKDGVTFRLSVASYKGITLTGNIGDNGLPEMKVTIEEKGNAGTVELFCDALLVAAGRRPNVTGCDLEKAGIEYDVNLGLTVNDKLQTTNPKVYGVGDCCSQYKFTHAADFMARAVIRNSLFFAKDKMSKLLIPYATFTSPEIASVGLYEKDLKEQGIEYRIFDKHFADNDRAICDDETVGLVRFRVDAKTDRILGASIVGPNAGNMISEITLAMQSETGLGKLAAVIHPYPTTAETVRQAGDLYNRTRLTLTVKKLLRGVIKIQR